MNRRSLFSRLLGTVAAVTMASAVEVFAIATKIKSVNLVMQQTWKTRVVEASGMIHSVKWIYRLAPSDLREDDDSFPAFDEPSKCFADLGLETPSDWLPIGSFPSRSIPTTWISIKHDRRT